jgi:hypothetical protein
MGDKTNKPETQGEPGDNANAGEPATQEQPAPRFRVLAEEVTYSKGGRRRRAKRGSIRSDIPAEDLDWLQAGGHIEPVDAAQGEPDDAGEGDE